MTPVYAVSNGMTQVDVHDFATVIGQDPNQWDALVDNTDDIFCGFSYVDRTIATIINNNVGRADNVCIKGLNNNQRHKFYKGLSLDIHFTKERVHVPYEVSHRASTPWGVNTHGCNIIIHLTSTQRPLWTIPSYSQYNRQYCHPRVLDDPSAPENPRTFYHNINIPPGSLVSTSTGKINVTLQEYIRFEKLSRWYWIIHRQHVHSQNHPQIAYQDIVLGNPIPLMQPPTVTPNFTEAVVRQAYRTRLNHNELRNTNSTNRNVRLQLSDMIFDIKDKISDSEFKIIMDKMLEFVC